MKMMPQSHRDRFLWDDTTAKNIEFTNPSPNVVQATFTLVSIECWERSTGFLGLKKETYLIEDERECVVRRQLYGTKWYAKDGTLITMLGDVIRQLNEAEEIRSLWEDGE